MGPPKRVPVRLKPCIVAEGWKVLDRSGIEPVRRAVVYVVKRDVIWS